MNFRHRYTAWRLAVLLCLLAGFATALGTRTEITGTAAAVQIASSGVARWVQFVADPGNAAAVRVGDSTVTSTSGARVAAGGGLLLPYQGANYTLASIYVYIASGDKVSVLWGD
jgi:hypothetical protein